MDGMNMQVQKPMFMDHPIQTNESSAGGRLSESRAQIGGWTSLKILLTEVNLVPLMYFRWNAFGFYSHH